MAGRNPLRRSRLLCAQDPGPCLGVSLPEIGAGPGRGSGPGRPAPLPLSISPSCGPAFMDAAVSSRERGTQYREVPFGGGGPYPASGLIMKGRRFVMSRLSRSDSRGFLPLAPEIAICSYLLRR